MDKDAQQRLLVMETEARKQAADKAAGDITTAARQRREEADIFAVVHEWHDRIGPLIKRLAGDVSRRIPTTGLTLMAEDAPVRGASYSRPGVVIKAWRAGDPLPYTVAISVTTGALIEILPAGQLDELSPQTVPAGEVTDAMVARVMTDFAEALRRQAKQ